MAAKKLTKTQKEVLAEMQNGCIIKYSVLGSKYSLIKEGEYAKDVNSSTVNALKQAGIIKFKERLTANTLTYILA